MEYILWKFIESFFFEFRYKKEARRNFSYLLLQLTQLKSALNIIWKSTIIVSA